MGKEIIKNRLIGCGFLLSLIVFNPYSWILLFDNKEHISLLTIEFFIVIDVFFIVSAVLFFINRDKKIYILHYLKLIFINSIITFLLFIIIELIFGSWLEPNKLYMINIGLNSHNEFTISPDSSIYTYTRDNYGFRGKYPDVSKIDILTVGGSTTQQLWVGDGLTFQDILQNEFQKNGKMVYIVNAGVGGQSTFGHIKNFEWWFPNIPKLKVKYYLFYVGVNDFYIDDNYVYDDLPGENNNTYRKIKNFITSRSALSYLLTTVNGTIKAHMYGLPHDISGYYEDFSTKDWVVQPRLSDYEKIMKDRLDAYEQRLTILCKKVESVGSIPIFVSQSMRRTYDFIDGRLFGESLHSAYDYEGFSFNGVDYYYMKQLLNERTKQVCNKNGGIFIDLDQELKFDIKNDFYDHCHNTPSGAEKIGKYLYLKLNHLFE